MERSAAISGIFEDAQPSAFDKGPDFPAATSAEHLKVSRVFLIPNPRAITFAKLIPYLLP
jgi:hypothetical protein